MNINDVLASAGDQDERVPRIFGGCSAHFRLYEALASLSDGIMHVRRRAPMQTSHRRQQNGEFQEPCTLFH